MLKGLGDLGNIMKLQKEFKSTQKRITGARMKGESTAGEVSAVMSGDYKLIDIIIDPDFAKGADAKKLQKMVVLAVNNAVDKVKAYSTEEMSKLTGGLNIPGLGSFLK